MPLIAAAADYGEDMCHLQCLRLHQQDESPSLLLTWLGAAMTWIKLIAFISGVALISSIVMSRRCGFTTRQNYSAGAVFWRWPFRTAASRSSWVSACGLSCIAWSTKASRDNDAEAAKESHELSLQPHTHDTVTVTQLMKECEGV